MAASCATFPGSHGAIAIAALPARELAASAAPLALREQELCASAAKGDRAAQRELFARLRPEVLRHVSFLTRRRAEVEDIVQEALLEVFRSLGSFQGRSSLKTWAHRITVRVTYRFLRRQRSKAPPPELRPEDVVGAEEEGPEERAETRDRHLKALRILETLSPKKRLVLSLHDLEGLEAKEIAKLVGAPVLTVRTRLFYARQEFAAAAREEPALAEYFEEGAE
ncbi:MAG: RNA polymerase sigma factor [Deltaproteobacteria bacterium]